MKKQLILILLLVGICSSNYAYNNYVTNGSETVEYYMPGDFSTVQVAYEVFGGPTDWYQYSEGERLEMTTWDYRSSITFYANDGYITRETSYDYIWKKGDFNYGVGDPNPWIFKVEADAESGASVGWTTTW